LVVVEPPVDRRAIEPNEPAHLHMRDTAFGNESANVTFARCQVLGRAGDVQ
jgi:hypothetical protein